MKENDIFKWSWKDEHLPSKNYGDAYRCCARLAKVIDGNLMDLFWSMGESSQSRKLDTDKVDLVYLGNLEDYQEVRTTDKDYVSKYPDGETEFVSYGVNVGSVLSKSKKQKRIRNVLEILECISNPEDVNNIEYMRDSIKRCIEQLSKCIKK